VEDQLRQSEAEYAEVQTRVGQKTGELQKQFHQELALLERRQMRLSERKQRLEREVQRIVNAAKLQSQRVSRKEGPPEKPTPPLLELQVAANNLEQITSSIIARRQAFERAVRPFEQELAVGQLALSSLKRKLERAVLRAPCDGKVAAIHVALGQTLPLGGTFGSISPTGSRAYFLAYAPSFPVGLERGLAAQLESRGKASMAATVVALSPVRDVPESIRQVLRLGKRESVTRVELAPANDRDVQGFTSTLQRGDAVTARIVLPKRRAISVLFDVLKRWLDAS
jgi:hypothetical protein